MALPKLNSDSEAPDVPQEIEPDEAGARSPAPAGTRPLISAETEQKALAALGRCLEATRRFWDKEAKQWQTEPDYAAQIRAAELTLAYSQGRPVERKFELRGNLETFEEKKLSLMKSPEGVRFLLAAGAISPKEAAEALEVIIDQNA